jgi:hypothetical protein
MKAILISTVEIQRELMIRFDVEPGSEDDRLPLGYWCVTDFGEDLSFFTLTPENFATSYVITETIENGWVAI